MDEAKAVVSHHLGLPLAPACQCLCPNASVVQLVNASTERDRVAIDDAGDDWRHLTCVGDDQDLIHQAQALLDSTLVDQRPALLVHGEPSQVVIAETLADRRRLGRRRITRLVVTATHLLQPDGDQQVPALHGVLLFAFQNPLGASEPAGRADVVSPEQEVVTNPERTTHGCQAVAPVQVGVMCTL